MHLNAFGIFKTLLFSIAHNALGVSLYLFGGTVLGLFLGIFLFRFWKNLAARKGWLAVHEKADPFIRLFFISLWILAIPVFSALAGLVMGSTLACNYVITHEHIVEQAGRHAFRAIAAAVVVNQKTSSGNLTVVKDRVVYAKRLMKGEESLSLDYLKGITPRNLAEASTAKLEDYLPVVENRAVHAGVVFITEHSFSWMVNAALDDRADFLYKTCKALIKIDETTDRDGRVTVEEIATTITRMHLEKKVTTIIFLFGAAKAAIILGLMALVMILPLLLTYLVRRGIAYYARRKAQARPA